MAERLVVEDFTTDPEGAEQASRLAGLVVRSWGLGGSDVWDVETSVGGLVAAGRGTVSLALHRHEGHVVVEVCDRARSSRRPGGAAVGLVDQVADAWGTRTDRDGTSVWLVKHTTAAT